MMKSKCKDKKWIKKPLHIVHNLQTVRYTDTHLHTHIYREIEREIERGRKTDRQDSLNVIPGARY